MSKRLKIILGVIGAILLIGTAATIYFWPSVSGFVASFFQQEDRATGEDDVPSEPLPAVDPEITRKANIAKTEGGAEAAIAIYDEAIANTTDKKQSGALYGQKAEVQVAAGNSEDAIASALKSIEVGGENLNNTSFLASLYEQAKNYDEAAKYYKKAANLVPSDDMFQSKDYYTSKATEMEAL